MFSSKNSLNCSVYRHLIKQYSFFTDYGVPNRILSTAGEIRREYEVQLQLAQEEFRRQHEAERIASEALIRKIQAEEQQQLAQLAEDKMLAKSLAKKQFAEKSSKPYSQYHEYMKPQLANSVHKENHRVTRETAECSKKSSTSKHKNDVPGNKSYEHFTKPKEHYMISRTLNVNKEICNAANTTTKVNNFSPEPGCSSNIKIYGLQSKEELRVPNDVINETKTLDVEVCITKVVSEEGRRGSAESGGSHDSINQEIHHFKPIKAMPRTPLLLNAGMNII